MNIGATKVKLDATIRHKDSYTLSVEHTLQINNYKHGDAANV
jgi:hypothetical protein